MGTWKQMSLHQGLRVLMEHRVASGIVAMATLTFLLMLLPRIILPFVLGMIASPILILATAVFLLQSLQRLEKAQSNAAPETLPLQGSTAPESQIMEHIMDTVVQGLAKAPAGDYPPYPVWGGSEYQGWLWTMENDKFDRSNTLDNWPPKVPGACKWWAHLQGSTLIIARDRALPEDSSHSAKSAAASQAHAQELEDALVVREIDLQGCRLSVLTEALQGKSRWLRKAPLELSHPDRAVFEGQQTVLLFAAGSAAKEQWFVALDAATSADGGAGSSVHALYNTFCDYVREHALVAYPEADDPDLQQDGLGNSGEGNSRKGQGRWLSRWLARDGSNRKQGKEKAGSKKPEVHAPQQNLETKSLEPRKAPPAVQGPVLNPTERMDMLWMGKQLPPTPKFLRDTGRGDPKVTHASPASPSVLAASPTGRILFSQDGAFRQGSAAEEHGTELRDLASPSQPKSAIKKSLLPPFAQSLPAMRLATNEDSQGNDEDDEDRGLESDEDGSSEDESQAASPRSQGNLQPEPGSRRASHKVRRRKQRASAAAHLPSVPVEAAVNMLLARVGFDLLRGAAFKQRVHAQIQKKLDVLRVPEYIQSIEVIDVELGSMVPGISNLRALPCPTEALWPQTVFDLDYGGGLTVIIEAKLDVRDSASWDTLDKAIGRLGGTGAGNATAATINGAAAVAALAAAHVVSPGESDEDEEDTGGAAAGSEVQQQKKVGQLQRLRNFAAKRMRNLAEITADHISKMHLRIQVDIHSLQGTVCAWVPPPPNDRLWFGFITAPELKAEVTPIVANDVRGRALMMSYQASSAPKWVADKLQSAITKNLTLPSCADIPLPYLLPVDHPEAGAALPGFLRALQGDASEAHSTTPDGKKVAREKRHKSGAARADSAASGGIAEAELPKNTAPAHKDEGKPHRGFLRWTRRSSRRSSEPGKATVDMEPVIQTEKDARRLSSGRRSAAHEQPAPTSAKELHDLPQTLQENAHQSPDVELSTFVTAAEHAREGKELQSFNSVRRDSEESERRQASGPLAEHSLVLSDRYGQATISTTLHEDGRVEAHSESVAAADGAAATLAASVTEHSPGSTHSRPSASTEAGPAPPAAAAAGAAAAAPGQAPDEAAAGEESRSLGSSGAVLPLSPVSSPPASALQELSQTSEGPAHFLSEDGSGIAEEEEEADALTSPEGNSPSAADEGPDDFSEGKAGQDTGAEGSSRHSHGAWKDIGGAMGKKYLEAFKNQKSITYSQGKKMASSLAGQAQEQMRKALAAREKAGKTDKRA